MQQNDVVKELCMDVLSYGDLLLIANKGCGKTNTLEILARAFRNTLNTRVIIFEDFPKWCIEFDKVPFVIIKDIDVIETSHTIDMENYFLRHERDYTVLKGREIKQALAENKDLIFVSEIQDIERQAFFIYSVINHFYRKNYLRAYKKYNNHEKIIFIIEESQNVFDSTTISKKLFNRLRKIFSVARNLDLHFVLASQRLQDLNTKIRGRTRLLIGRIGIDDYQLKIRRLLRHSKHRKEVLNLEVGSFLYPSSHKIIRFPKFQPTSQPYEYKPLLAPKPKPQSVSTPQPKPKKMGTLGKLINLFKFLFLSENTTTRHRPQTKNEDNEEDLGEEHSLLAENEEEETEALFW